MKLYIYDHCPYCVRARMIIGLRNLDCEEIVLSYDDEETPMGLVGKKLVPILIKADGTPMGESLDIVRYLDETAGGDRLAEMIRPELEAWLEGIRPLYTQLTSPREIRAGLPEFASEAALKYFITKKTPIYGDFDDNFSQTAALVAEMNDHFAAFADFVASPTALGEKVGYEDIITFPLLRNLTLVKDLNFPAPVRAYLETMSEQTKVPLYFDRAI